MTFLEAAIEVLRDSDEALHFSDIAKLAVDKELLSHVGRDPEGAMRTCLTSALRGNPPDALLERVKPGIYGVKPGAKLPARAAAPKKRAKAKSKTASKPEAESKPRSRSKAKSTSKAKVSSKAKPSAKAKPSSEAKASPKSKPITRSKAGAKAKLTASDLLSETPAPAPDEPLDAERSGEVTFEAPEGSGLEGPTDVALVMANAMSRIVDERPELRSELEAMQSRGHETEGGALEPKIERKSEIGRASCRERV